MAILYSRIKDLANEKKISLAQLERELNFSNGIISTWKSSNPSIDKVEKVANYFNVSTDYLLGREKENSTPTTYEDLGLPYKGIISDDVNAMYRSIAETYAKQHNIPKRSNSNE
ncbi:helix-turn-helix transcriptional regulator [Lactobacillus sp.]|uniref:helix-turn-helix domain-containing protein n=1 Tax=Lactobacillus sp. TaxID=1591 RepID=UPI001990EFAF|nr:helix-turn-helix transcriptional regulator [Lactobacillus sp.]MBD5429317.1 helix-turn-helix transcriptional regulator [Lactobacillus sp.]